VISLWNLESLYKIKKDSLYVNSFFLYLTSISNAGFGFFFWIISALIYSQAEIGIASALISSMALIILLSRMGLDQTLIRFLPSSNKQEIFSTYAILTTIIALFFGIIFVYFIQFLSPELIFLKSPLGIGYLFFVGVSSISNIGGTTFISLKSSKIRFFQSLLLGIRIILLVPLTILGAFGIFCAVGGSFLLSAMFVLYTLPKFNIRPKLQFNFNYVKELSEFSKANYFASLLLLVPGQLLPLLVLNITGPENAAIYYIAYTMSSIIFMIPNSISTSLLVEGSHGEALKVNFPKAFVLTFIVLVPAVVFLYLFGGFFLNLINPVYLAGFQLLQLFLISTIPSVIIYFYFAVTRIQKDNKKLIIISLTQFLLIISLSYILLINYGLIGIGYAFVFGNLIAMFMILLIESPRILLFFPKKFHHFFFKF